MTVKLTFPKRGFGDQSLELELDDAKQEIENAAKNGYIATFNGKQIHAGDVKDGQDVKFYPTGVGG